MKWPDLIRQINEVKELRAVVVIMPLVPYMVLALGFVMGWRYANTGLILGSLVLALSYYGLYFFRSPALPREVIYGQSVTGALACLMPLNLALASTLIKRRPLNPAGGLAGSLLAVQMLAIFIFCHPSSSIAVLVAARIRSLSPIAAAKLSDFSLGLGSVLADQSLFKLDRLSTAAAAAFGLALFGVLLQFVKRQDIRTSGFFFAIIAALLAVTTKSREPAVIFYFTAAGLILIITTVEASFSMAYIDELTGLPGRRGLNEMLLNLGKKYTIAMIDVDRFKKFNDTYGHKTGDQVLKMIAARLSKISGGAKTFRYGGEEFTAIFTGKSLEETVSHVEQFRKAIESTPFVVRGKERRRNSSKHRRPKTAFNRRTVNVTVSIGLAAPGGGQMTHPEKVIKAADKKLYQAKKGGRNRTAC